ncbi:hypothetical protein RZS28_03270 [Methylocapsa polymorpha]|uniref:Uncharacterized protein n=1 Tax=Methylocapsa polymorpha TaxID=3080828 RepID=A0ABZ0HV93_9HYPH|nr:hypothetical protein RZS28_03270 [Methylocapsa sp. RX1]
MTIFRLVGACCVATGLLVSQAQAHGGVSNEGNKCVMKIGPYQLDFTGYQPENSIEKFCDDIPETGRTVIVLDVEQGSAGSGAVGGPNSNDLRDMAIDLRILKNVGQASDDVDLEKNTVVYVGPKKYPAGTLHWEHNFAQKGNFIGLVSATNDHGQVFVSRFPFAVGEGLNKVFIGIGVGVLLVGGAIAAFLYHRRGQKSA